MELQEANKEKQFLTRAKPTQEVIELASRLSVIILGGCYMIGLLITNTHLARYGVFHLNFLQTEYVTSGALWVFLVGYVYCFAYYLIYEVRRVYRDSRKEKSRRVLAVLGSVVQGFIALGVLQIALGVLSNYELKTYFEMFKVVAVLTWNVVCLWLASRMFQIFLSKLVLKEGESSTLAKTRAFYENAPPQWLIAQVLFVVVLALAALSGYAIEVFPKLSPVFGGGKAQVVQFVAKPDQVGTLAQMGFVVDFKSRRLELLNVLFETTEFFLVIPPDRFEPKGSFHSMRIRKDLIDIALYHRTN